MLPQLDEVRSYVTSLALSSEVTIRQLAGGGSGSTVYRLDGAQPLIIKVTTQPDRLRKARIELRLLSAQPQDLVTLLPRFVAGKDETDSVFIVIGEYARIADPGGMTVTEWVQLALAIARVHSATVPAGMVPRTDRDTISDLTNAANLWELLGYPLAAAKAARILDPAREPRQPECLIHGDCHIENIVRDHSGHFRFIDWQDSRIGDGYSDLAFMWQRAKFDGLFPPRQAMLSAYAGERQIDPSVARAAIDIAELRLLFTSWPPYLSFGSLEAQRQMKNQFGELVAAVERAQ